MNLCPSITLPLALLGLTYKDVCDNTDFQSLLIRVGDFLEANSSAVYCWAKEYLEKKIQENLATGVKKEGCLRNY